MVEPSKFEGFLKTNYEYRVKQLGESPEKAAAEVEALRQSNLRNIERAKHPPKPQVIFVGPVGGNLTPSLVKESTGIIRPIKPEEVSATKEVMKKLPSSATNIKVTTQPSNVYQKVILTRRSYTTSVVYPGKSPLEKTQNLGPNEYYDLNEAKKLFESEGYNVEIKNGKLIATKPLTGIGASYYEKPNKAEILKEARKNPTQYGLPSVAKNIQLVEENGKVYFTYDLPPKKEVQRMIEQGEITPVEAVNLGTIFGKREFDIAKTENEAAKRIYERASPIEKFGMHAHTLLSPTGTEYLGSLLGGNPTKVVQSEIKRVSHIKQPTLTDIGSWWPVVESAVFNPVVTVESAFLGGAGIARLGATGIGSRVLGSTAGKGALLLLGGTMIGGEAVQSAREWEMGFRERAKGRLLTLGASVISAGLGARAESKFLTHGAKEILGLSQEETRVRTTAKGSLEEAVYKKPTKQKWIESISRREIQNIMNKGKITYEDSNFIVRRYGGKEILISKYKTGLPTRPMKGELVTTLRGEAHYAGRFKGMDVYVRKSANIPIEFVKPEEKLPGFIYKPKFKGGKSPVIRDLSEMYRLSAEQNIAKNIASSAASQSRIISEATSKSFIPTSIKVTQPSYSPILTGSTAYFSRVGTPMPKEVISGRVVSQLPQVTTAQVSSYMVEKTVEREKEIQAIEQQIATLQKKRQLSIMEQSELVGLQQQLSTMQPQRQRRVVSQTPIQIERQLQRSMQKLVGLEMVRQRSKRRVISPNITGRVFPKIIPFRFPVIRLPMGGMRLKKKRRGYWRYFERVWPIATGEQLFRIMSGRKIKRSKRRVRRRR